jgi:hypothetical protein
LGLVGALLLSGCGRPVYSDGVVKREAGNVAGVVESSGALFGNGSVKIGDPTYVLQVETDNGLYTMSIYLEVREHLNHYH